MPGLVPGIHVFARELVRKAWMAGTKPGHDEERSAPPYFLSDDHGKFTKFSRLSKQMLPYILRYDARSAGSL